MPRPQRCRRICGMPAHTRFNPEAECGREPVLLSLDEYESIRLMDREGLTHEQCAEVMQVSRTTVTEIYETARKKIAQCLIQGVPLRIEGGKYRLCEGNSNDACTESCPHRNEDFTHKPTLKGEPIMRIAVTYENGAIFQHFGHTQHFKLYDVEDNKVVRAVVMDAQGYGHGALAGFLKAFQVDVLICGGIGGGAINALANAGIDIYPGIDGSADMAGMQLLSGVLPKRADVRCSHHDHDHNCGDHGCH